MSSIRPQAQAALDTQGDLNLNICEAHAFNTLDKFSLDVFVVNGWKGQVGFSQSHQWIWQPFLSAVFFTMLQRKCCLHTLEISCQLTHSAIATVIAASYAMALSLWVGVSAVQASVVYGEHV